MRVSEMFDLQIFENKLFVNLEYYFCMCCLYWSYCIAGEKQKCL